MKKSYESAITGIKGLAILLVINLHFILIFNYELFYSSSIYNVTPLRYLFSGNYAVYLFFVISGYLTAYTFYKKPEINYIFIKILEKIIRFLFYSLIGTFISYLLSLIKIYYISDILKYTGSNVFEYFQFKYSFYESIYNAIISTFIYGKNPQNPVLWFLQKDLLGVFICYFGLFLSKNNLYFRIIYWTAINLFFILLGNTYSSFSIGVLIYFFHKNNNLIINKSNILYIFIFLLIIYLGSFPMMFNINNYYYTYIVNILYFVKDLFPFFKESSDIIWIFGSALLVIFMGINPINKLVTNRFFIFLGKYSLSIFICHFLILTSISSYLYLFLLESLKNEYLLLIVYILSLPIVLLFSLLIHYYVISPTDKLIKLSSCNLYKKLI